MGIKSLAATRLQAEALGHGHGLDLGALPLEGIDHDIADAIDLRRRDAFAQQVLVAIGRGCPEQIG